MFQFLHQYLLQYRELNFPGIGIFTVSSSSAETDFPNKSITPAVYRVALHHGAESVPLSLYNWLATALGVTSHEAVRQLNDFSFDVKKRIKGGEKVEWKQVGVLSAGLAGEIRFDSFVKQLAIETPITATKIIRENAQHTIRVGEDERSSEEMKQLLNPAIAKRKFSLLIALILLFLSIVFVGWYLSQHGLHPGSVSNTKQRLPVHSEATYRELK